MAHYSAIPALLCLRHRWRNECAGYARRNRRTGTFTWTSKPLRTAIERDRVPSMILWGPPGVGKTTIAQIIAK